MRAFAKGKDIMEHEAKIARRRNNNDFYWKLEGEENWKTWREVCEHRREFGSTKITERISIAEYERRRLLKQNAKGDYCVCVWLGDVDIVDGKVICACCGRPRK